MAATLAVPLLMSAFPAQAQNSRTKKPPAQRSTTAPSQGSDYWSVNSSFGSQYDTPRSRATDRRQTPQISTEMTSEFGRIPVQTGGGAGTSGSIGFTSGGSVSSGRFSDGREVPGLNPNTQKESSFVGVGLRVQSGSKGLPVPLPTPWNRVE